MAGTNGDIKHVGVIEKVDGRKITVRVVPQQACSGCNSKASCHISGDFDKMVEVIARENTVLSIGESVNVSMRTESGFLALFIGYILPLVLLVVSVFTVYYFMGSEAGAAIGSLTTLALYYAVLYLFRHKLNKKFTFYLEKPV